MERKHRHLLAVARALRFKARLPIHLWGDCLLTSTCLINRTPSSVLNNSTPYEILEGKPPLYSHLKTIGCLCYSSTLSKRKNKFYPRAYKCVFLGYPSNMKGYRFMDLDTHHCFDSRDVIFYETIFPYGQHSRASSYMVPENTTFIDYIDNIPSSAHTENESSPVHLSPQHIHFSNEHSSSSSHTNHSSSQSTHTDSSNYQVVSQSTRPVRVKSLPHIYTDLLGLPSFLRKSVSSSVTHPIQGCRFHLSSFSYISKIYSKFCKSFRTKSL